MRTKIWLVLALVTGSLLFTKGLHAATITSSGGGTWSNPSIWVGGVVPGNNDDVVIESGHFITIDATDTVNSLRVRSSGINVFTINPGVTLRLTTFLTVESTSGAFYGTQIVINGTLRVGGNLNMNSAGAATKATVDMGEYGHLYLGGSVNYGSAGTITSSGGFVNTIHYAGTSPQTLTVNANTFYSRVFIENTAGVTLGGNITTSNVTSNIEITSGTLSDGGYTITGNTDSLFTIKSGGILDLTGTNTLPSGFDMVLETGSTVVYHGTTQTVGVPNNGQNYSNLQINCSDRASLAGTITVANNLTIVGGDLDVTASNYNITVRGNWLNSGGTFTKRAGTVTFGGTGAQAITANSNDFYNLVFNNSSAGGVTINDNVTATNGITFTDGVITTGANILTITNTSAASVSGHSSASFVYGYLRRYIASNTSTYAFPVGDGTTSGDYQLANLINGNLATTSYITGSFGPLTNHNNGDMTASDGSMTYLSVANDGVWTLTPNSQPTGGTYDIQLYITNFSSQFTDNEFGPLKRDEGSMTAADWSDDGGSLSAPNGSGRLVSHGYGLRTGLGSFSEFGMGRASTNGNPLPIQLVNFAAAVDGDVVNLSWVTEIEVDNDYFTVERSDDGINFVKVADVDGAGSSSVMHEYSLVDNTPGSGEKYYRLRQTDFNGEYTYSHMVSASIEGGMAPVITVYPNPVNTTDKVSIRMEHVVNNEATVEIFDMGTGKLLYNTDITGTINNLELPAGISAGMYLVRVHDGVTVSNTKLMVQ